MAERTTRDRRFPVPVRRVFPWWYLVGAVVSLGLLVLLAPGYGTALVAFWGPAIGIPIREREDLARTRLDRGQPVDRNSLLAQRWLEPTCALLLLGVVVGLGLLVGAFFAQRMSSTTWGGVVVLTCTALCFLVLVVVLRLRRRVRRSE
ncbi:hypothetical protein [Curtobacterium sp. 9128]|uniref:hypothetical protein n=1 Tax=Curtobacterium sp. 9128 TaxID=1793722 RepID=UPI0011A6D489|nr:hypothetical protein [Curtobacterium sp. 9128]